MKKQIIDTCRLCGKKGPLSYEHVPPRGAFNNHSAKQISGDKLLEFIGSDEKPWDVSKLWGKIQQQGTGGYYLCNECNEKTGSWYVPPFIDFVHGIYSAIRTADPTHSATCYSIKTPEIQLLPIFKEIMVMFCDINRSFYKDKQLCSFLLEKENSLYFDKKKYRVFCYIKSGELFRMNGLSTVFLKTKDDKPLMITLSEISFFPVGFALYVDMPDDFQPQGYEITCFSDSKYDDMDECEMILPVLENNTIFSGDYRTKTEIEATIKETKEWEKSNQELLWEKDRKEITESD